MIEFDRIRKSSILRDKIYFICNHIKFYSTSNPFITAFYFLTQSLALISTFTSSPLVNDSSSLDVLKFINSLFFFYTHSSYTQLDCNLLISHLVSLILLLSFITIIYFSWSVDHQNHLNITKIDENKIKTVQLLVFLIILFHIPLGSFIWFYIIKLSENNMVYLAITGIANLVFLFVTVYIVQQCSIQSNLKNYKSLSRLYSKNQSITSIVKMMIRMMIASFNNLTSNVILLSVVVLMIFDVYQLRQAICSKKYLNSTTQSIYYYKNVITVILQTLLIASLISSFPLIANNFILLTFSTSFLAFIALSQYKKYKKNNLILQGIDIASNEDDAKIYMLEMISMIDQNKKQQEIYTLSLITIHREKCQQEQCFCRKFNYSKDSKIINSYNFIRLLVMSELEKNVEKFPSSFLILSILLNYKLSIMFSFSKIYYILKTHINKNDISMQSFSQQFMLYQIQRIIQTEVNKNTDKMIKVQKIFTEDLLQIKLTSLLHKANDSLQEKYRLLNQQICNLNMIDNLGQEISNVLRTVQQLWIQYQQKDSYNLKIYETFLIYFQYIIFSKRISSKVRTTLLKKAAILRHLKAITQQNLQKFVYSTKATILQIIFNKDKTGIITNITTSCKNVFNFKKEEMISKPIDDIMPEYFLNEHKKWIKQWFQHQTLEGKMKQLISSYFVDKHGNGFTCNLNMKISSDGFRLKFYLIFVKANSNDYLILNSNFDIEGIGQKLQNQQLLQKNSLKKSLFEFTDMKKQQTMKELQQKKMIKKRVIFRNITNLDNSQKKIALAMLNVTQVQFDKNTDRFIFECQILFYQRHVNNFKYYIIKFIDIKKLHRMSSNYFFNTISISKNLQSRLQYYGKCYKKQYNNEIFEDYSALGIDNLLETDKTLEECRTKNEKNQQINHQIERNNISSIAESGYDGNILFYKLSDELKQKTLNYEKATDQRFQITSFIVFLMIGIVGASSMIQSIIFEKGMSSYQQLFFVSSSVSTNSQFLSVMYNRVLTMNYYCGNSQHQERCQFILMDTKGATSMVYQSFVQDYKVYLLNKTTLTSTKFYSYYDSPVSLIIGNKSMTITAKEFIEYYYYSIEQIRKINSKTELYKTNMKVGEFKSFLLNNWEVMKKISQDSLSYYSRISTQEFKFMKFVTIFLYSLFLLTTFIFLLFLYRYFLYIEQKKEKIVKMYSFLTNSMCNKLKIICQQVRQCLQKGYKDLDIEINIESLRDNSHKGQFRYHQGPKYHILFIIFFLLMCSLNSIILYRVFDILDPAEQVVYQSSKMRQSENKAIQNLLDMKIMFLSKKYKNKPEKYAKDYEQLVQKLNKTQIDFTVNAKNMQYILTSIGNQIVSQVNNLLTNSVCQVLKQKLPPFLYQRCKTGLHYTILNNLGSVSSLNFMIRNQLNTLIKINSKQNNNTIFYTPIFEDIDDNILYLITIYEMISDTIKNGMKNTTDKVNQLINVIIFVQILILAIALIVWTSRIKVQKKKISDLYGQVFQLPQIIFKENKVLMRTLEDNLTLKL